MEKAERSRRNEALDNANLDRQSTNQEKFLPTTAKTMGRFGGKYTGAGLGRLVISHLRGNYEHLSEIQEVFQNHK